MYSKWLRGQIANLLDGVKASCAGSSPVISVIWFRERSNIRIYERGEIKYDGRIL